MTNKKWMLFTAAALVGLLVNLAMSSVSRLPDIDVGITRAAESYVLVKDLDNWLGTLEYYGSDCGGTLVNLMDRRTGHRYRIQRVIGK